MINVVQDDTVTSRAMGLNALFRQVSRNGQDSLLKKSTFAAKMPALRDNSVSKLQPFPWSWPVNDQQPAVVD